VGRPRRRCTALRWRLCPKSHMCYRSLYAITQARNTSAIIAACSAWVPGNHAGMLGSGDETFSSGFILAWPSFRAFFVLRDAPHSKGKNVSVRFVSRTQARRTEDFGEWAGAAAANPLFASAAVVATAQQIWQFMPPVRGCIFTGKTLSSARVFTCLEPGERVYSGHHSAYAGRGSARPPGADTHDGPRLLPPWRGPSLLCCGVTRPGDRVRRGPSPEQS